MELNPTPSPHTVPPTLNMALSHPHMGPPGPGSSNGHPGQMQYTQQYHQSQGMLPQGMHMVQLQPGQGQTAFGGVMGAQGPQGGTKVYASVYSGIPVFEAMIRGTSVMRRSSDSWVNATQILKVAGIPKSARTKILEKEILTGLHEKVQGGYGKYQGTWIPFQRGQELAAQYGVTQYLAPIFDFIPSPSNVAALPVARAETPDRKAKTAAAGGSTGYNALLSQTPRPPSGLGSVPPSSAGRVYSPMHPSELPPPPPPQFQTTPDMMLHHQQQQYMQQQMYQSMYYPPPMMPGARSTDGLGPPVDLNGYGMPPSHSDVYIDQFGQPHSIHFTANGLEPPTKRIKGETETPLAVAPDDTGMAITEEDGETVPTAEAEEDDSDDEMGEKPALPSAMRLSTKPTRPKPSAGAGKARSRLLELFQMEDKVDVRSHLGGSTSVIGQNGAEAELEVDVDTIIDDQGHTALHWASSLAQMDLVRQLVELGADIHRGNYAGETPLMRSVLTTNHSEANSFPDLLTLLGPSVRTLDLAYRSVIHHISLVAGVKGRAGCARGYMAAVLGWVARDQQQQQQQQQETVAGLSDSGLGIVNPNTSGLGLKTLVDVQDVHGDTALNVAARVGNKGLVGLLVEAGADKARANKLGLKPADFGIETEVLKVSPAETVVSNLKSEVSRPERHSRDIQKNIGAIFETVNETFTTEMLAKQTKLNAIEASVRHATRALADKRQQVQKAQAALSEIEQIQQRSENVKRSLQDTMADGDWTGCTRLSTETTQPSAFRSTPTPVPGGGGEDIGLPNRGEVGALVRLRRMAVWEDRMTALLNDRIQALQGEGADKAVKYRRLVSLCTKVPVDKVDGMLDGLAAAIESDGSSIDLSRISTFMSRVKQDETMGNGTATTA